MFGKNKEPEVITKAKYKFSCPHCSKENIQEFRTDTLWKLIGFSCQHCDGPLLRGMHPRKDIGLCIQPLYKAEKII